MVCKEKKVAFKTATDTRGQKSKNLRYQKTKNRIETEIFFLKNQLFAIFSKQIVFFMSNLHLECFELSFDIHIVHVGQK